MLRRQRLGKVTGWIRQLVIGKTGMPVGRGKITGVVEAGLYQWAGTEKKRRWIVRFQGALMLDPLNAGTIFAVAIAMT